VSHHPGSAAAFVFPGQGSQKPGMLAAAHAEFPVIREVFDEASQTLGYALWELVEQGPQEALNLTATTQPLLLTASFALWRAWRAEGGAAPAVMAGHSLGEFSALVCAGALDFQAALKLVEKRGEFMQSAVPVGEGAMAAILGLEDEVVNAICADVAGDSSGMVAAVNYNAPGQVVIAGHVAAVETAIDALKSAGAKRAMPLPVSAPFHTQLMAPAGMRLDEILQSVTIHQPGIPVIHNVHAAAEENPERIRELLVKQISSPVQWTKCVLAIRDSGAEHIVECGPGAVLTGLNKRIDKTLTSYTLEEPDALRSALNALS